MGAPKNVRTPCPNPPRFDNQKEGAGRGSRFTVHGTGFKVHGSRFNGYQTVASPIRPFQHFTCPRTAGCGKQGRGSRFTVHGLVVGILQPYLNPVLPFRGTPCPRTAGCGKQGRGSRFTVHGLVVGILQPIMNHPPYTGAPLAREPQVVASRGFLLDLGGVFPRK